MLYKIIFQSNIFSVILFKHGTQFIHIKCSSADVAFPEISLCPGYNGRIFNWDYVCKTYNVCDVQTFKRGFQFPQGTLFSTLMLSDYYRNITYSLEDFVSAFDVGTTNENDETNRT